MTNEEMERALVRLAVATYNELMVLHARVGAQSDYPRWLESRELHAFHRRFLDEVRPQELPGFFEELKRQDAEGHAVLLMDLWEQGAGNKN